MKSTQSMLGAATSFSGFLIGSLFCIYRLHTSVHAMKHKAKNKAISESTVVNAGHTNDVVLPFVPHAPCNINKENVPVTNVGSMENVGISVLLKKMDAPAKVTNTKKKIDPRKKTLRKL